MAVPQEDQRTKIVSQGAIDAIRKMGMSAAIKKYTAGEGGAEFKTAVERYYSPQRLKAASTKATQGQVAKPGTPPAAPSPPAKPMPPSKEAVSRRIANPKDKKVGVFGNDFGPNIFPKDFGHSYVGKKLRKFEKAKPATSGDSTEYIG